MHAICFIHLILLHLITLVCTGNTHHKASHYEIFSSPLLLHVRPTDIFHRIMFLNNLSLLLFQQHRLGWHMTEDLAARWLEAVCLFIRWDWQNSWKISGRVSGLQTEIAAKLQARYLVCRLRLLQKLGRVSGLQT
jgi:hypothetical protein